MGPRLAVIAVVGVLAALVVVFGLRLLGGAFRLLRTDGGEVSRDPQFAEPAVNATRPPELTGEGDWPVETGDPSDSWDLGEQTPVDKTAEELSREAEAGLDS